MSVINGGLVDGDVIGLVMNVYIDLDVIMLISVVIFIVLEDN